MKMAGQMLMNSSLCFILGIYIKCPRMKKAISKNKSLYFFIALLTIALHATANDSIAIIPKPLSMQVHDGDFVLSGSTAITTSSSDTDVTESVQWFIHKIATSTGYHL